jgi:hypothetical protein
MRADEWNRRFDALMAKRREIARTNGFYPNVVERDAVDEVRAVRKTRAARRREEERTDREATESRKEAEERPPSGSSPVAE